VPLTRNVTLTIATIGVCFDLRPGPISSRGDGGATGPLKGTTMDYLALALSEQWMAERRAEAARHALAQQARAHRRGITRRVRVRGAVPWRRLLHLAPRPARTAGTP
jgi:hypothetical protein